MPPETLSSIQQSVSGAAILWLTLPAGAIVYGAIIIMSGTRRAKLRGMITGARSTPINMIRPDTHVKVKGVCRTYKPLDGPGKVGPCVYYQYKKILRHQVVDGLGRWRARVNWIAVDEAASAVPFVLEDGTDRVVVDPKGALVDATPIDPEKSRGGGLDFIGGAISRRIALHVIRPGDELLVVGNVFERGTGCPEGFEWILGLEKQEANRLMSVKRGSDKFFISTRTEEELLESLRAEILRLYSRGTITAVVGALVFVFVVSVLIP